MFKKAKHIGSLHRIIIMASLCVIIVNDKFNTDEVSDRPGAWDDAMHLKDALKSHGNVEFEVHGDLDFLQMIHLIENGE